MTLSPIIYPPGICKNTTQYAAGKEAQYVKGQVSGGRYTDCDKVRFVAGFPEKIGGWSKIASTNDANCALLEFRDNLDNSYLAIGAYAGLYLWDGNTVTDITPLLGLTTVSVASATISVDASSNIVVISATDPTIKVGDMISITSDAVGGISFNTWFKVTDNSNGSITVINNAYATATTSATQKVTLQTVRGNTTGMSVTEGSSDVAIDIVAAGVKTGNTIMIYDTYSLGGISLNGKYVINKLSGSSVIIDAGTKASATVSVTDSVSVSIGITSYTDNASVGTYGNGAYGSGLYGKQTSAKGYDGIGWILQAYGQQLLSLPIGGTIYVYDPTIGGRSIPLLNAPNSAQAFVVTPERYVIALGINDNFLELAWPDQDDYTDWTTSMTNTANQGRTLQGGSTFICGVSTRNGTTLLFTDKSTFQASYVAGTYIYNTPMLSDNTGIISANAKASIGNVVFWMGSTDFWTYDGSVSALPSDDIREYVYKDINLNYMWKCFAGTYLDNKEVWFFYPSSQSTVCDKYVIYHTDSQCWSIGTMTRSMWCHDNLFTKPFGTDESGNLFSQETSLTDNGEPLPWFLETSDSDISDGAINFDLFGFIPDFDRLSGDTTLIVNTSQYPMTPATSDGPFTINEDTANERVDLRCSGKLFSLYLSSEAQESDFRLGLCRVDFQAAGARR